MRQNRNLYQQQILNFSLIILIYLSSSGFIINSSLTEKRLSISHQIAATTSTIPVARAVMFWMDGCPHCHEVIDHVLPPIQAKYGDQFQILLIELVGGQEVVALYEIAESKGIPKENVGVPFLIIGEHTLVGGNQIPAELPSLIDQYLAEGGVNYPDSPALAPLLPTSLTGEDNLPPSQPTVEKIITPTKLLSTQEQSPIETAIVFPLSTENTTRPNGFTFAIIVMVGMILAIVYSGFTFLRQSTSLSAFDNSQVMKWVNLILVLIGLLIAIYLAFIEKQSVAAVCGPIGDCNAVQHSPYARLFGFLPVGILGVVGYLAILLALVIKLTTTDPWSHLAKIVIFSLASVGTLYSLYLTYLEPFVIKAVCMWCLSSAVIMTLLFILNLNPAIHALKQLKNKNPSDIV